MDANTPAGSDPALANLDLALAVGRSATGRLQRLKGEIADAQAAAATGRFWPLFLLRMFSRLQRRRRIREMTAEVQVDLDAFDAAVEALRAAGLPVPVRADMRSSTAPRQDWLPETKSGRSDTWAGPRQLVEVALRRVEKILDELRRMKSRT